MVVSGAWKSRRNVLSATLVIVASSDTMIAPSVTTVASLSRSGVSRSAEGPAVRSVVVMAPLLDPAASVNVYCASAQLRRYRNRSTGLGPRRTRSGQTVHQLPHDVVPERGRVMAQIHGLREPGQEDGQPHQCPHADAIGDLERPETLPRAGRARTARAALRATGQRSASSWPPRRPTTRGRAGPPTAAEPS